MTDLSVLENKISQLEERIKILEQKNAPKNKTDDEYMTALYQKAKEIVKKYNKHSIIFIQKKLIIDMQRAKEIYRMLEESGDIIQ